MGGLDVEISCFPKMLAKFSEIRRFQHVTQPWRVNLFWLPPLCAPTDRVSLRQE